MGIMIPLSNQGKTCYNRSYLNIFFALGASAILTIIFLETFQVYSVTEKFFGNKDFNKEYLWIPFFVVWLI